MRKERGTQQGARRSTPSPASMAALTFGLRVALGTGAATAWVICASLLPSCWDRLPLLLQLLERAGVGRGRGGIRPEVAQGDQRLRSGVLEGHALDGGLVGDEHLV